MINSIAMKRRYEQIRSYTLHNTNHRELIVVSDGSNESQVEKSSFSMQLAEDRRHRFVFTRVIGVKLKQTLNSN